MPSSYGPPRHLQEGIFEGHGVSRETDRPPNADNRACTGTGIICPPAYNVGARDCYDCILSCPIAVRDCNCSCNCRWSGCHRNSDALNHRDYSFVNREVAKCHCQNQDHKRSCFNYQAGTSNRYALHNHCQDFPLKNNFVNRGSNVQNYHHGCSHFHRKEGVTCHTAEHSIRGRPLFSCHIGPSVVRESANSRQYFPQNYDDLVYGSTQTNYQKNSCNGRGTAPLHFHQGTSGRSVFGTHIEAGTGNQVSSSVYSGQSFPTVYDNQGTTFHYFDMFTSNYPFQPTSSYHNWVAPHQHSTLMIENELGQYCRPYRPYRPCSAPLTRYSDIDQQSDAPLSSNVSSTKREGLENEGDPISTNWVQAPEKFRELPRMNTDIEEGIPQSIGKICSDRTISETLHFRFLCSFENKESTGDNISNEFCGDEEVIITAYHNLNFCSKLKKPDRLKTIKTNQALATTSKTTTSAFNRTPHTGTDRDNSDQNPDLSYVKLLFSKCRGANKIPKTCDLQYLWTRCKHRLCLYLLVPTSIRSAKDHKHCSGCVRTKSAAHPSYVYEAAKNGHKALTGKRTTRSLHSEARKKLKKSIQNQRAGFLKKMRRCEQKQLARMDRQE